MPRGILAPFSRRGGALVPNRGAKLLDPEPKATAPTQCLGLGGMPRAGGHRPGTSGMKLPFLELGVRLVSPNSKTRRQGEGVTQSGLLSPLGTKAA